MVVYLIKLFSSFLRQFFDDIEVNYLIESQVCIILYYTLIGIEVGIKTYYLIEKKYVKAKKQETDKKKVGSVAGFVRDK